MKKQIFFLSITLFFATKLFSQGEEDDFLVPSGLFINNVSMLSTKAAVIKNFGNPIKTKKTIGADIYCFDYIYKGLIIKIDQKNKFIGFDIADSSFILTYKSIKIKVGDPLNVLKKNFPKSYKSYTTDKEKYFRVKFKDVDSYILFTIKNNKIMRIETWEDDA